MLQTIKNEITFIGDALENYFIKVIQHGINMTNIEYCDLTWNFITGCAKISAGCAFCWADKLTKDIPQSFPNGFDPARYPSRLNAPYFIKHPMIIFPVSMGDIFYEGHNPLDVLNIFRVMNKTNHFFIPLTKRIENMFQYLPFIELTQNICMGVTIESRKYLDRLAMLKDIPAQFKWISYEPAVGPLGRVDFTGVDWLVFGGESGERFRPYEDEWVREVRDQCIEQGIPFFFKQKSGINPKPFGRDFDNVIWSQFPIDLQLFKTTGEIRKTNLM